jgi:hypothetical protein
MIFFSQNEVFNEIKIEVNLVYGPWYRNAYCFLHVYNYFQQCMHKSLWVINNYMQLSCTHLYTVIVCYLHTIGYVMRMHCDLSYTIRILAYVIE